MTYPSASHVSSLIERLGRRGGRGLRQLDRARRLVLFWWRDSIEREWDRSAHERCLGVEQSSARALARMRAQKADLRSRIATLEEDLAGEAATSQARLEALQRIARAVGAEGSLMVAEQVERRIAKLEAVATEAAAMLAETNHGGLSHARRVSMRRALEAAGVPIPAQCSACPHEGPV